MPSFPHRLKVLTMVLALSATFTVDAIVIRHDTADTRYRAQEADFPQVFSLHTRFNNKVCMATLISPRWALTAAHCLDQTPILETVGRQERYEVRLAERPYRIVEVRVHPDYLPYELAGTDLALVKLDRDAHVEPLALYRDNNELDQVVSFVGWGYTGQGTVGRRRNDGRFRRAENTVFEAEQWLKFRFDDPREASPKARLLEGIPGLGDSGGPALFDTEAGRVIMGVARGELQHPETPDLQGVYGSIEIYERVSRHLDWIDNEISQNVDDS
jgi:secreted trypsin-like serine protease